MKTKLIAHTIIFDRNREFLIIKRADTEKIYPGFWDVPGGAAKENENQEKAALREIFEETGLKLQSLHLINFTCDLDLKKKTRFVRMIFLGIYSGGKIKLNHNDHTEFKWIKFKNIKTEKKILKYIEESLKKLKKSNELMGIKKFF